ncbi:MAG: two-component system nitrogen regulation sensor histidine kinase NtrY [Alteromonadaceae bacterium]|jgi:two-component system nitrogen regulation sensor histidine kinase NtrY
MAWINQLIALFISGKRPQQKDDHTFLALIMCIPCLFIASISLFIAGVSNYLIAFVIIVLSLFILFVVMTSRQRSEQQIRTLSNIIESMIDGDYSLRGRLQHNQAFQELLELVNNLADTLSQHKIEAKESRLLLEKIMEQMDAMVLAVNDQGFVVMANDSARKLLFSHKEHQHDLSDIKLNELPLGHTITQAKAGIIEFDHSQLSGEHFLFKESFLSEGKQHQLYLITSAERLLIEKERKAWQSILRVLSHEMNNSLTPIASISQAMKKKLQDENKPLNRNSLCDGVSIINERADSLSSFIASYSQLSHLPLPNNSQFDLNDLVIQLAKLFEDCQLVSPHKKSKPINTLVTADKSQLEQVLINILKNARESMLQQPEKTIEVDYQQDEKYLHLLISDQGSGIANKENLFVPFYSTKPQGSGIGLTLCRQIMFNHGGLIKLTNRKNMNGAQAVISLPLLI